MDAKHIVIAKMFKEEINSLLKGKKERQPAKKKSDCVWWINFLKNICQIFLQKRGGATKKKIRRLGPFDCQGQFTNAICGKYVAKIFNFTFVSKIKFPFRKVVFARNIARVS